ncbi:transporter substrate-binding domain-containing protein [Roseovarius sp. E0-M6]|uniref:transporter substrate-binding domain-containing protein n=1 Tax=Roseovarius sp. E0-M6 TaxID=3127118 RepID=UPI0030101752
MHLNIFGGLLVAAALMTGAANAETCGGNYKVRPGESLSIIADTHYKNAGMWTVIHANNLDVLGENPNAVRIGMTLRLRCIDGLPKGLPGGRDAAEVAAAAAQTAPLVVAPGNAATRRRINVLTGSDFAPFTDKSLPNGGMLAEVVQAAMEAADPEQGFAIHWVDDWASHHEPLLSNALLDIGFPWFQPDCEAEPEAYRCANLDFSASMFEVLMLMFVDRDRPIAFNSDADLRGKTLCRPSGYSTYIFDQQGRNWLKSGHIDLVVGTSPGDCLDRLVDGDVDGAVLNEFLGRRKLKEMGLQDRVRVAEGQPISIDGNHMIVHKSHPQGAALLKVFEGGLAKIKEDGTYQRIIDEHMARVWAEF